jgi:hypothetical protein
VLQGDAADPRPPALLQIAVHHSQLLLLILPFA